MFARTLRVNARRRHRQYKSIFATSKRSWLSSEQLHYFLINRQPAATVFDDPLSRIPLRTVSKVLMSLCSALKITNLQLLSIMCPCLTQLAELRFLSRSIHGLQLERQAAAFRRSEQQADSKRLLGKIRFGRPSVDSCTL